MFREDRPGERSWGTDLRKFPDGCWGSDWRWGGKHYLPEMRAGNFGLRMMFERSLRRKVSE